MKQQTDSFEPVRPFSGRDSRGDQRALLWRLQKVGQVSSGRVRLQNISLEISAGTTAILGESGAGKSSLLNLLAEFERPASGTLQRQVSDSLGSFALPLYWVPQGHGLWPHLTCREHVAQVNATEKRAHLHWLQQLDLEHKADVRPAGLSQGERARLALARCLAADAAILLMDEPFAHIDAARVRRFRELVVQESLDSGRSLIFTTHNPESVLACAERVICLQHGECVAHAATPEIYFAPATPEIAAFLGPANWIDAEQARNWLENPAELLSNGTTAGNILPRRCVRPEQLVVCRSENASLVVLGTRFLGAISEVRLRHSVCGEEQTFFHRSGEHLSVGDPISLKVVPNIAKSTNE